MVATAVDFGKAVYEKLDSLFIWLASSPIRFIHLSTSCSFSDSTLCLLSSARLSCKVRLRVSSCRPSRSLVLPFSSSSRSLTRRMSWSRSFERPATRAVSSADWILRSLSSFEIHCRRVSKSFRLRCASDKSCRKFNSVSCDGV